MANSMLSTVIKPLHPEGYRFVALFGALTALAFLLWQPLGWVGLGLTLWCYYFFRDPIRIVPDRAGLMVSAADGVVSCVDHAIPPAELGLGNEPRPRVCVFMNVFDCHINRIPIESSVEAIVYRPGKFLNASLDKASEDNERNGLVLRLADGRKLAVVQIAGLVARRILCHARVGDHLPTGARFGLIRFGSRVDVYLPPGVAPLVVLGQRTIAGETVIADLLSDERQRKGIAR